MFYNVYNWERDPIRKTIAAATASLIRRENLDIEGPLNVTLPTNAY